MLPLRWNADQQEISPLVLSSQAEAWVCWQAHSIRATEVQHGIWNWSWWARLCMLECLNVSTDCHILSLSVSCIYKYSDSTVTLCNGINLGLVGIRCYASGYLPVAYLRGWGLGDAARFSKSWFPMSRTPVAPTCRYVNWLYTAEAQLAVS